MFVRKNGTKLFKIIITALILLALMGQFGMSYTNRELNTVIKYQVEKQTKQDILSINYDHLPKQESGMYISFGENVDNATVKNYIDKEKMLLNLTIEAKDENNLKNISIFYNNVPSVVIGEGAISIDNEEMFRNNTFFRYNASFTLLNEELEKEGFYNITVQIFNGENKVLYKKLLFTLLLPSISIVDPSEFSQVEKSFNLEWSVTHEEIVDHVAIYINEDFYNNVSGNSIDVTLPVNEEEEHLEEKYYYFTLKVRAFTLDDFFNYTTITIIYVSPPSEPSKNPLEISSWFYVLVSIIGFGIISAVVYFVFKWKEKRPSLFKLKEKTKHQPTPSLVKKKEKNEKRKKEAKKIVSDLREKRR